LRGRGTHIFLRKFEKGFVRLNIKSFNKESINCFEKGKILFIYLFLKERDKINQTAFR